MNGFESPLSHSEGDYLVNGAETLTRQVKKPGFPPETSVRAIEDGWD